MELFQEVLLKHCCGLPVPCLLVAGPGLEKPGRFHTLWCP